MYMNDPFQAPNNLYWTGVSSKLKTLRILRILPFELIPISIINIVAAITANPWVIITSVIITLICLWISYYLVNSNYKSWGYIQREDDLWIKHGRFFQKLTVVPYGRMQLIDISAGPIERYLKVSTVKLHTAAATTDAEIISLEPDMAAELKETLTAKAKSYLQGI